jgi:hypothetical protein
MRTSRSREVIRRLAVSVSTLWLAAFMAMSCHGRTVVASLETTPTVPNQDFSFVLSLQPQNVNISGFNTKICFDANAVSFVGVDNNTGQSGVTYINGDPIAYAVGGKPTINTAVQIAMQAVTGDLVRPLMLGRVSMRTTASFTPPLQIHLEDANLNHSDGLTGPAPFSYVDHTYDMREIGQPAAQVSDFWAY